MTPILNYVKIMLKLKTNNHLNIFSIKCIIQMSTLYIVVNEELELGAVDRKNLFFSTV